MSDKIYNSIVFSDEFTVDDWNSMIEIIFRKYFISDDFFSNNKDVLRTEVINYIKFCKDEKYMFLFDWIFNHFKIAIEVDKELALKEISTHFYDISETDFKWMTNSIIHPELKNLAERDKIYFYFKAIDDIIEGCFKPRFFLFYKFVYFNKNNSFDLANNDFGRLINEFINLDKDIHGIFLKDPILDISINQWRNISAHKSFKVEKDFVVINYGKKTIHTQKLSYENFYSVVSWIMNIYRILRLAEILIDLNFIPQIVENLGGTDKIAIRFESSMMHLIHNMQIVGFEFISTQQKDNTYIIKFKKKNNHNLNSSIIHASQCLDKLSHSIYRDEIMKEKFKEVEVQTEDVDNKLIASARIKIEIALKRVNNEITLAQYIDKIVFNITNYL